MLVLWEGGGGDSLKVRQGAVMADGPGLPFMTCASLCPTLLPQAEDMLPRSGEEGAASQGSISSWVHHFSLPPTPF